MSPENRALPDFICKIAAKKGVILESMPGITRGTSPSEPDVKISFHPAPSSSKGTALYSCVHRYDKRHLQKIKTLSVADL